MTGIKFAGNDYLGLSKDPRLAEAMYKAALEYGVSATSSRFFVGWTEVHRQLEKDLAAFFCTESACLIPAAYLGGLLYFTTMAEKHKVVFCDEFSHSNLFLGMRAAGLQIRRYRHLDQHDLAKQLSVHFDAPPIVCTDSVFGISGELAPAGEIAEVARRFKAELFIDDAHGVFALGRNGRGVVEEFRLNPNSVTVLGSMSKALGCGHGFFVGNSSLMERLQRASVGSSPVPIPMAAACREAIRIVSTEPALRKAMWQNAQRMREVLTAHHVPILCDQTPIVTMFLKDEEEARRLDQHFESQGLLIRYAKYPSEPRQNLLRASARASYSAEDLARFEAAVHAFFGKRGARPAPVQALTPAPAPKPRPARPAKPTGKRPAPTKTIAKKTVTRPTPAARRKKPGRKK